MTNSPADTATNSQSNPLAQGENYLTWLTDAWPTLAEIAGCEFAQNGPGFLLLLMDEADPIGADSARVGATYYAIGTPQFEAIRAELPAEVFDTLAAYDPKREAVLLVRLPDRQVIVQAAPPGLITPLEAAALAPIRRALETPDVSMN